MDVLNTSPRRSIKSHQINLNIQIVFVASFVRQGCTLKDVSNTFSIYTVKSPNELHIQNVFSTSFYCTSWMS